MIAVVVTITDYLLFFLNEWTTRLTYIYILFAYLLYVYVTYSIFLLEHATFKSYPKGRL